jgi:beta-ribofuranosylaminobenzene 5'-phosphate synthase
LVTPHSLEGASRKQEVDIFMERCPVPLDEVREICHEIIVRMLPGLTEHDLDLFGASINRIQHLGFKKIELERQSTVVPSLIHGLLEAGAACAGMSSFGPTVYAISDGDMRTLEKAAHDLIREPGGDVIITKGRNIGAQLRTA